MVEIRGLDVYDPTTGEVRSSSTDDIACWFIDTDYDGEGFFVRHAYFTGADDPYDKLRRALRADIDEDAWATLYSTVSRPFPRPSTGKIAVKVINHYGDEVLRSTRCGVKLVKLEVQNYRSLFADAAGRHLVLDLGDGVNCIVGPNNCGKSNIFRALAVALDPDFRFDRAKDMPASTVWAKPTITLTFHVPRRGRGNSESTLLRHLESYERSAQPNARATYASQGIVKYKVTIEGGEDSVGRRRATFVASGAGAISLPDEDPLAKRAIAEFHKCLHFVLIESGQSLGSLLEGKFRDFLRSVLNDELRADYRAAERHRAEYVERIQSGLLEPLTTRIMKELKELFPEVTAVSLRPDVGDLEDTLARMHVDVTDLMETDLADKGTGVRGGVLVAMLRHLADASRRSMLFAIEEPEAFLHPGAQERLREDLEQLAKRVDVSLLVTTHSPFIVSRREEARVFALDKNTDGRTEVVASATGAQPQAGVLGGLFRDRLIVDVLDRAAAVPASARAVVVVEGDTDECYLRLAAERAGRPSSSPT